MNGGQINISLTCDESSRLLAVLDASGNTLPPTRQALQELIVSYGFDNYLLDDQAIDNMLALAEKGETGTFPIGSRKGYSSLSFEFDEETGTLYAVLEPVLTDPQITEEAIGKLLAQNEFDAFFCKEDALEQLMSRIANAEQGRFEFSRRLDATVTVELSQDKLEAFITTTPPYGGKPLTIQDVKTAVMNAHIDPRFYREEAIIELLREPVLDHKLFMVGIPVKNGRDTRFTCLVKEVINKELTEDEHGEIDLRDLNEFVLVSPGTPLMRRTPPKPGVDGCDLEGIPIPAVPIQDIPFGKDHSGAIVDAEDENLLIAEIKGHPVIFADAVKVDPVLHLRSVNLETGDIDFDGSVEIVGDVQSGMEVNASGNVLITGVVEKATVTAGNDLTVAGGVMGGTLSKEDKEELEHASLDKEEFSRSLLKSRLKAGGSVSAKFINMANVECGRHLTVTEYVLHSVVNAKGRVMLGQSGGKGYLIGGHCHADEGILVNYLGNENYVKTHATTGLPNTLVEQQAQLQEELEEIAGQLEKLKLILTKLDSVARQGKPNEEMKGKLNKVKHTLKTLNAQQVDKNKKLEKIKSLLDESRAIIVEVTGTAFPNVSITINGLEHVVVDETEGGKYFVEGLSVKHEA